MNKVSRLPTLQQPALLFLFAIGAILPINNSVLALSHPLCVNESSDPDGDGFGWENNTSCIVQATPSSVSSNSLPDCASAASDPDGDGFGWENATSCIVQATPSSVSSGSLPDCASTASDPDGDGFGWENNTSCRVSASVSEDESESAPSTTALTSPDPLEVTVTSATCDSSATDVKIINSIEDLVSLNDPSFRIFCVAAGDYRSAGTVRIQRSGKSSEPRVLRPQQDWPSDIKNVIEISGTQRVLLGRLELDGASHWLIDGIHISNPAVSDSSSDKTVRFKENASDNVLQRSLIEGGRIGVRLDNSHRNILQRNIVRRTTMIAGEDSNCINIAGDPDSVVQGNRVVSNEAYDCTDSLQLVTDSTEVKVWFPGTVIANNDFYLTNELYTDCSGNPDPNGPCSSAEGRLDIKGGGTGSSDSENVRILRNRIWGARRTDPELGGSSWGSGIAVCCAEDTAHVRIEDNIIFDSDRGISVSGDNTRLITIANNKLIHIGSGNYNSGHALLALEGTRDTNWHSNVIYQAETWGVFRGLKQNVHCNSLLDAGTVVARNDTSISNNFYYGNSHTAKDYIPSSVDHIGSAVSEAEHTNLCLTRRQLTNPEQICLPYATVSADSPHLHSCEVDL